MKTTLLTFAFALTMLSASAQQPDSLRAKVSYSFKHIEDTTQRDKPYTENMLLLLGRNASLYLSMDRILAYREQIKALEEQMKNASPGEPLKIGSPGKKLSSTNIYQFANEKKMVVQRKLINDYLVEEALPVLNWSISADTLTIAGLKCQKATTSFKGRNYTAWFCPDLPFQSGPWKLNGLPGLIIEAYDSKRDVEFKFEGFELVKNTTKIAVDNTPTVKMGGGTISFGGTTPEEPLSSAFVELPKKGLKTTQKEFDKLKEAMEKDPQGFINSALGGLGGGNIKMSVAPGAKPPGAAKPINNPIELAP